jgi:hypothetical protein
MSDLYVQREKRYIDLYVEREAILYLLAERKHIEDMRSEESHI